MHHYISVRTPSIKVVELWFNGKKGTAIKLYADENCIEQFEAYRILRGYLR
jgi:hypothetical protein